MKNLPPSSFLPDFPGKSCFALIVDDQPEVRTALRLALEMLGMQSESAAGGLEALEKTAVQSFDLILLDINMPDMDGFEVCRNLKRDPKTSAIPVIFLSGRGGAEQKQQALDLGASAYLAKPFALGDLKQVMEEAMASSLKNTTSEPLPKTWLNPI